MGSPPRVRRAGGRSGQRVGPGGVTSARAESGSPCRAAPASSRGHLRACGERALAAERYTAEWGSPPRACGERADDRRLREVLAVTSARVRRAAPPFDLDEVAQGVTSARAESGDPAGHHAPRGRGHLRACGERSDDELARMEDLGSPPRVRRAVPQPQPPDDDLGVTSARAESGCASRPDATPARGHLRACGERTRGGSGRRDGVGSPPRVRRAVTPDGVRQPFVGVTSARAESGVSAAVRRTTTRGYLRACGERIAMTAPPRDSRGSPPRVRRAGLRRPAAPPAHGVTSARAESGAAPAPARGRSGGHLRACGERRASSSSAGVPARIRSIRSL